MTLEKEDLRGKHVKIVKTATRRVIVIDEYIDAATFEMLDVRAKGVTGISILPDCIPPCAMRIITPPV